jgi:hypothetical protein
MKNMLLPIQPKRIARELVKIVCKTNGKPCGFKSVIEPTTPGKKADNL